LLLQYVKRCFGFHDSAPPMKERQNDSGTLDLTADAKP